MKIKLIAKIKDVVVGYLFDDTVEVTVGREIGNSIAAIVDNLSRHHAKLYFKDGAWYAEDLGSTNGSYRNGEKFTAAVKLAENDMLRFGLIDINVFFIADAAQPAPATVIQPAPVVEPLKPLEPVAEAVVQLEPIAEIPEIPATAEAPMPKNPIPMPGAALSPVGAAAPKPGIPAGIKLPPKPGLKTGIKLPPKPGLATGIKLPPKPGLATGIKLPPKPGLKPPTKPA